MKLTNHINFLNNAVSNFKCNNHIKLHNEIKILTLMDLRASPPPPQPFLFIGGSNIVLEAVQLPWKKFSKVDSSTRNGRSTLRFPSYNK